jgi:hypothetical protein
LQEVLQLLFGDYRVAFAVVAEHQVEQLDEDFEVLLA